MASTLFYIYLGGLFAAFRVAFIGLTVLALALAATMIVLYHIADNYPTVAEYAFHGEKKERLIQAKQAVRAFIYAAIICFAVVLATPEKQFFYVKAASSMADHLVAEYGRQEAGRVVERSIKNYLDAWKDEKRE